MTTYREEPLAMHTHYFKMWIRIAAFVSMRVQNPTFCLRWASDLLAKPSAFIPVPLSDIILKRHKTTKNNVPTVCMRDFFLPVCDHCSPIWMMVCFSVYARSKWPFAVRLQYQNETVIHTIIISTFVRKCRCSMHIDMAFSVCICISCMCAFSPKNIKNW